MSRFPPQPFCIGSCARDVRCQYRRWIGPGHQRRHRTLRRFGLFQCHTLILHCRARTLCHHQTAVEDCLPGRDRQPGHHDRESKRGTSCACFHGSGNVHRDVSRKGRRRCFGAKSHRPSQLQRRHPVGAGAANSGRRQRRPPVWSNPSSRVSRAASVATRVMPASMISNTDTPVVPPMLLVSDVARMGDRPPPSAAAT